MAYVNRGSGNAISLILGRYRNLSLIFHSYKICLLAPKNLATARVGNSCLSYFSEERDRLKEVFSKHEYRQRMFSLTFKHVVDRRP